MVKNPPANVGDASNVGSISKSGRSPGGGYGNPLQYSCLENPIGRGDWRATVHKELGMTEQLCTQHFLGVVDCHGNASPLLVTKKEFCA